MKKLFTILFLLFVTAIIFPQENFTPANLSRYRESSLQRIENAFRTGNPGAIDDMINSGVSIRLEDSLYQNISNILAMEVLEKYFEDKDSIYCKFPSLTESGTLEFSRDGIRSKVNVEVWLNNSTITALNISNYPRTTAFFKYIKREKKSSGN